MYQSKEESWMSQTDLSPKNASPEFLLYILLEYPIKLWI